MTEVYRQTEIGRPAHQGDLHSANLEAGEMAAFEKGRMQGELEAIRRMEAEQTQLKTFPAQDQQLANANAALARPDVVEINRLTWLQRLSAAIGEGTAVAYVIMIIVWGYNYRGGFGWSNDNDTGDNYGNVRMWNTHLLTSALGLFCLSQALLMYRILPLRTPAVMNRAIYLFWQAAAVTCFIISLVGHVRSQPEASFWGAESWCFAFALALGLSHSLYSMMRTIMHHKRPVDYETWAETNTKVTHGSPEQRRDHSTYNAAGRTVYTPAPHFPSLTRGANSNLPAANANVGAQVPVAPANAPRWTENPNTHSEDYFLMPRAKWGVIGYFALGASILMNIAVVQHVLAAGRQNWSQYTRTTEELYEVGNEAKLISATALIMLISICMVAYAAMPPRTTLVKNGILVDNNRRSSISHNAETRIGHNAV